jgi:mannose-6-phosphate isomerase-like protein (cupin superfamily)
MIETGRTYTNPKSGGKITFLTPLRIGEPVEVERTLPSGTGKGNAHVHLDLTERFEVVSGTVVVEVGRDRHRLAESETLEVPVGTPHRNPFNEGPGEATFRLVASPMSRFFEAYAETYVSLFTQGRVNRQDELGVLQISPICHATNGQSFIAGAPIGLQKVTLPLMAGIGRLLGNRPVIP